MEYSMIVSDKELLKKLQDDGLISKNVTWLSAQEVVDYGNWLDDEGVPYWAKACDCKEPVPSEKVFAKIYNPNIRIEL